MNIKQRVTSKTPKFFRIVRNIGLIMSAIGTTLVTPVPGLVLPDVVHSIGGYLIMAGLVAAAVSQVVTTTEQQ